MSEQEGSTPVAGADEPEITEADVAAAEAEAEQAERAATELEELVKDGDESVTFEAIAEQKNRGVFARLRAEAAKRKLAKAKEAKRLAALQEIHDEIHAYSDVVGDKLAKLLQACHDANQAYRAAVDEHNAKVVKWHHRAAVLDVPSTGGPRPPAEHGRLAISAYEGTVRADMIELGVLPVKTPETSDFADRVANEPHNADELIEHARIRTVGHARGPEAGLHYYRGTGGMVIGFDKPFSDAEAKTRGLTKVSTKEVFS